MRMLVLGLVILGGAHPAMARSVIVTHLGVAKVDCPTGDLGKLVRKVFRHGKADTIEGAVTCAGGHFPDAGWAIGYRYGVVDKDEHRYFDRLAIVSTRSKVVKMTEHEVSSHVLNTEEVKIVGALDFDADFTDEVVVERAFEKNEQKERAVAVYGVAGKSPEGLFEKVFESSDAGVYLGGPDFGHECKGSYKLERDPVNGHRSVVITGTVAQHKKTPPTAIAACVNGTETWGPPRDQHFVKLP